MTAFYIFLPFSILILLFLWIAVKPGDSEYMDILNAIETPFGRHFKVLFHRRGHGPRQPIGEPVVLTKSLLNIIPTLLFFFISIGLGVLIIKVISKAPLIFTIFLLGLLAGALSMFWLYSGFLTSKVYVYQNCMVIRNCWRKQVFYYYQLDAIVSDIGFTKGPAAQAETGDFWSGYVSLVYDLIKNGQVVFSLDSHNFINLTAMEKVFTMNNPYVRSIENTGLHKPELKSYTELYKKYFSEE